MTQACVKGITNVFSHLLISRNLLAKMNGEFIFFSRLHRKLVINHPTSYSCLVESPTNVEKYVYVTYRNISHIVKACRPLGILQRACKLFI